MTTEDNRRRISETPSVEELWSHATLASSSQMASVQGHVRKLRHDARGALNQIIGYAEMLIEDAEDDSESQSLPDLRNIEGAAKRLLGLVDGLAAFANRIDVSASAATTGVNQPTGSASDHSSFVPFGAEETGKLLVVDDNELNRDLLVRRLKRRSYEVVTADGGAKALELLGASSFDLVLLDVMMPDVDGFEVLERLRATHDPAALPVIMATALGASEDVVKALKLGANDYVTKPLDMPVVLARVAAQLSLKRARDQVLLLNRRLELAQERIARLAETSMEALQDVETWASDAAEDVALAIGASGISVWFSEDEELRDVTNTGTPAPSAQDFQVLASSGRVLRREDDTVVPITGLSGQLFGALVVPASHPELLESDLRLLESFARQLGGALELRRARLEVEKTAARRRQQQNDLVEQGVDVLRLCPTCGRCFPHTVDECDVDGAALTEPPVFPYRINRRYKLTRFLGQGGMGMVFSALDERLGRDVAVKVVRSEHFDNHMVRLRFEKEARAVARVDHPGVVAVYDCGELDDGGQYIVMELLQGADLQTLIKSCGPGTPQQVAKLLRQAGAALSAAHRAGIVHRDIKPDNLFLVANETKDDFRVRIVDFGVAKEMNVATSLTQTGMLVGTPLFMSPEQLMGQPVEFRSDVYSFAAVGFLALTGRRVSLEEELINVVLDVTQNDPPRVSELIPGVPPEIDRAFNWALSREPGDRPSCAETWAVSFAEALEALPSKVAGWGSGISATMAECAPQGLDDIVATAAETRLERGC